MKFDAVESLANILFKIKDWLLLIVALIIIYYVVHTRNLRKENEDLINNLKIAKKEVEVYKDKNNELTYQIEVMIVQKNNLSESLGLLGVDKKRLERQVGSLNNLVSYWKGKASIAGRIDTVYQDTTIYRDTTKIKAKKLDWTNGFLSLKQLYNPQNDSVAIDYTYSTGIEQIVRYKSNGFLKKKTLVVDLRFEDKSMKLDSSKYILVDKTGDKKWYQTGLAKYTVGIFIGLLL